MFQLEEFINIDYSYVNLFKKIKYPILLWFVPYLNMFIPYVFLKSTLTMNLSNREIATTFVWKYMSGIWGHFFINFLFIFVSYVFIFFILKSNYLFLSLFLLTIIGLFFVSSAAYSFLFNNWFKKIFVTKKFWMIYKENFENTFTKIYEFQNYDDMPVFLSTNKSEIKKFISNFDFYFRNSYMWNFFEKIQVKQLKNPEIEYITNSRNYPYLVNWNEFDEEKSNVFWIPKKIRDRWFSIFNSIWGRRFIFASSVLFFSIFLKFTFENSRIGLNTKILKHVKKYSLIWIIYSFLWSFSWFITSILLLWLLPTESKIWVVYFTLIIFSLSFTISQLKIFVFNKKFIQKICKLIV
ncbi:hypothetical protein CG473_01295 [Mycoplasma testudineum]|nr:hypothetical protein CG473_01295 [Mycoplasma testudineum]